MPRKATTFDLIRPGILMTQMIVEANFVIALRFWGTLGAWKMGKNETRRMLTEKIAAAQASGRAMTKATLAGATPGEVATAGLQPVRRRTRANAERLTRAATGTSK